MTLTAAAVVATGSSPDPSLRGLGREADQERRSDPVFRDVAPKTGSPRRVTAARDDGVWFGVKASHGGLALLLLGGCASLPSIKLVEEAPPAHFSQTDNLDAPRPQGDPVERTRKLFLGVVAALRQQGRASAALAFLDDYDRSYPRDPRAQLLRADCLVDLGQPAAAAALYQRLQDGRRLDGAQEAAAYAGLGQTAAASGHWAEAAQNFAQATRRAPSNVAYLNNQGYALLRAGDAAQAEFSLRKAAELDPANLQSRNNLVLCLRQEGKPVPQTVAAMDAPTGVAAPVTPVFQAPAGATRAE